MQFMILFFMLVQKNCPTHGRLSLIRMTIYHYTNISSATLVLYLKLQRYLFIFLI